MESGHTMEAVPVPFTKPPQCTALGSHRRGSGGSERRSASSIEAIHTFCKHEVSAVRRQSVSVRGTATLGKAKRMLCFHDTGPAA